MDTNGITVESDDKQVLLQSDSSEQEETHSYQLYRSRWYILFQFSLLSFLQTAIAGTWSPISLSATKALHFTQHDYDLLANWGVTGLLIFLPFDIWLLNRFGLRLAVLFGSVSVFIGTILRSIPAQSIQKYLIHAGQFFNGIGGCPVMSCAPFISNTWFPFRDRVLATGIMLLAGNLGSIFSSLLGPFLVQQPNNITGTNLTDNTNAIRHEITIYMLIELGVGTILILMMATYFPNKPPTPPSRSASAKRFSFLIGIKALLRNPVYWCMVASFVLLIGGAYAWLGIAPMLFENKGISQKSIGLMMTVANSAGFLIGILFSWAADRLKAHRSYMWIVANLIAYFSAMYIASISLGWIQAAPFLFNTGFS